MTAPAATSINLRALLEEMIERDASDLHITAGERAKLRVDGDITNSGLEYVLTPKDTLQLAYSVLTENQKKRFEMEDELDFSFGIQNLARFRGNCFKQRGCVSMVIRQGMAIALIGTLAGLVIGVAVARVMRGLLYEVSPSDPYIFAGASAVLLLAGFAASLGPALRAASVQPLIALRHE